MINNLLALLSAFLLSVSFIIIKLFQRHHGTGLSAGIASRGIAAIILTFIFFACAGWKLTATVPSILLALGNACCTLLAFLFGLWCVKSVNLSVYSLFAMLGGMLLPFIMGFFFEEKMTWIKGIGMTLIIVSMLLSLEKNTNKSTNKKNILFFLGVFCFNGLSNIFMDLHEKLPIERVTTFEFMCWTNIICIVVSAIIFVIAAILAKKKGQPIIPFYAPLRKKNQPLPATPVEASAEVATDAVCADTEATAMAETAATDTGAITETFKKKYAWMVAGLFLMFATVFALSNGFGNFIVVNLASKIEASIKYPIITGGNIVFSMLGGLLFKEKITWRKVITLVIVVAGTVLMML